MGGATNRPADAGPESLHGGPGAIGGPGAPRKQPERGAADATRHSEARHGTARRGTVSAGRTSLGRAAFLPRKKDVDLRAVGKKSSNTAGELKGHSIPALQRSVGDSSQVRLCR